MGENCFSRPSALFWLDSAETLPLKSITRLTDTECQNIVFGKVPEISSKQTEILGNKPSGTKAIKGLIWWFSIKGYVMQDGEIRERNQVRDKNESNWDTKGGLRRSSTMFRRAWGC